MFKCMGVRVLSYDAKSSRDARFVTVCMYVCMYVCVCECACVCVCVCVCMCMCMYTCICMSVFVHVCWRTMVSTSHKVCN